MWNFGKASSTRRVSAANLEHVLIPYRQRSALRWRPRTRLKLERFGLPNKPSETPAHRRWVGAESENKPSGTPERLEKPFRCAVTRRVSAANLEVERFGAKSTVYSLRKISRPEHRNVPKGRYGAKAQGERSEPEA